MTIEEKIEEFEYSVELLRGTSDIPLTAGEMRKLADHIKQVVAMLKKSIEQTMHYRNLIFARHVSSTIGLDTLIKSDNAELLRAGEIK